MKECIIFGAGFYGSAAYYKLSQFYKVIYYADNNENLWGNMMNGLRIISPKELYDVFDENKMVLVICCRSYMQIWGQLHNHGITESYAMIEGFMYYLNEEATPNPISIQQLYPYTKKERNEKNILYVQNTACIRTHKIATVMKNRGYKVFLLYLMAPPSYSNGNFKAIYSNIFTAFTADEVVDFVNNSEFDIVHSSNEPDILTSILVGTNKKIVFDTHDMMSRKGRVSIEELTLEYIATTKSAGLLHVTQGCYEFAKNKYHIANKPALILGNFPLMQYDITEQKEKLSQKDGEIHCVYEGGMVFNDKTHARYFMEIWKKLTNEGIHIHFYTNADAISCRKFEKQDPYLHYEGNLGTRELVDEMTQYDCGLVLFNINDTNRSIYEQSSANKLYEYINSEIPIISNEIDNYNKFVQQFHVGGVIDYSANIKNQILQIRKIKIPDNMLRDRGFTMEAKGKEIEQFYKEIMEK